MTYQLNEKIKGLKPYEVPKGRFTVRMDANESFLPVPQAIKKDIISMTRKVAFNRYPETTAQKCRKAFGGYYGIDPDLVTAGNGSDELITLILNGFFSRGDKLLLTEPDFSMYAFNAHIAELQTVVYQKGEDYRADPAEIIELARKEDCRGIIFSNPCNPTSQGIRKGPLRTIIRELPEVLVIVDEAYMDFWNQSLINEAAEYDNLILLRTASKALGGASIRLGFAVGCKKLTKVLQALKSPYNVSSTTQAAGEAIFKHPDLLKEGLMDILAGRGFLAGALAKLEADWKATPYAFHLIPEPKTNFVVLCFADKAKHKEIYEALKKKKILIRCFPDFLRVTVGSTEENQVFLSEFTAIKNGGEEGNGEQSG
ncbi:MAG: aminotransferase class I/II-fold pyridoxal phosphate-dependent enzyme [Clostridiales bacterium]|nr:aminotransferase class I/II-fold pyridoxal phosphate-dependent enzyme [Clostridiales bacterium]